MSKFDSLIGDPIEGMGAGETWARSRASQKELEHLTTYEWGCVQEGLDIEARPFGALAVAHYLLALVDPKKGARGATADDILEMYGRTEPSMDYLLGFVQGALDAHRQAASWIRRSLEGPDAQAR